MNNMSYPNLDFYQSPPSDDGAFICIHKLRTGFSGPFFGFGLAAYQSEGDCAGTHIFNGTSPDVFRQAYDEGMRWLTLGPDY